MSSLLQGIATGVSGGNRFYTALDNRKLAREKFEEAKSQFDVTSAQADERNRLQAERNEIDRDKFELEQIQWDEGKAQREATEAQDSQSAIKGFRCQFQNDVVEPRMYISEVTSLFTTIRDWHNNSVGGHVVQVKVIRHTFNSII